MENKEKSFFVPWRNSFSFGERKMPLKLEHNYKQHQFYFDAKSNHYFSLINDNSTPKSFIDALINKNFDDAMSYVSRLNLFVDFEELKKIFDGINSYNCISVSFKNTPAVKGEKINSVFVSHKNKKMILHFYLVNEPDCFSKWKIYRVEEERVTGNFEREKVWIKF